MGFSALDGLVMATRCGTLDAGVVLHLLEQGMDRTEISDLLYRQSGLLGLSGLSGDLRTLLASDDPAAHEAIEVYVHRAARETAALAGVLRGLDPLVFTGGVGENAASVRERLCERLDWLGVRLADDHADDRRAGERRISADGSRVAVWVIPADEERVIAQEALQAVAEG